MGLQKSMLPHRPRRERLGYWKTSTIVFDDTLGSVSKLPLDFSAIREARLLQSHARLRRLTQSPRESNQSGSPRSGWPPAQNAQKEPSKVRLAPNQAPDATAHPARIDRCADPRQLRPTHRKPKLELPV